MRWSHKDLMSIIDDNLPLAALSAIAHNFPVNLATLRTYHHIVFKIYYRARFCRIMADLLSAYCRPGQLVFSTFPDLNFNKAGYTASKVVCGWAGGHDEKD